MGAAIAFPSISAADLFSVLGVGGVAFVFAFRDILQNLLAGILILLTRPFRIGDQADPAPLIRVSELGDFAVQLDVLFWIDPPAKREALDAVDAVLGRIKPDLQQAGVDLPYSTTQVLFHDQTEASDGDRTKQRDGWPARDDDPRPRWRVLQEVIQGEDKK